MRKFSRPRPHLKDVRDPRATPPPVGRRRDRGSVRRGTSRVAPAGRRGAAPYNRRRFRLSRFSCCLPGAAPGRPRFLSPARCDFFFWTMR